MPCVPRKSRVPPSDHVGRDAALPVRRPRQRDEALLAGDAVRLLDRVAHGEDVGVAGAHLIVHDDAAALADLDAGHLGERGLGLHPDAEDHDVRRVHVAGIGQDLERSVACLAGTPSRPR